LAGGFVDSVWSGSGRSSDDYQMGKTKVFLRNAVENALEDERQKKIVKYVILLQTYFRGYIAKIHYKRVRGASIFIQRSTSRIRPLAVNDPWAACD